MKSASFSNWIRYLAGFFAETGNCIVKTAGRYPVFITPCSICQATLLYSLVNRYHIFPYRCNLSAYESRRYIRQPCIFSFNFGIYMNKIPLASYTLSVFIFPQRIALSNPIIVAMAPSIFSVDFSLSALIFPAGSVRIKNIIHHPSKHRMSSMS